MSRSPGTSPNYRRIRIDKVAAQKFNLGPVDLQILVFSYLEPFAIVNFSVPQRAYVFSLQNKAAPLLAPDRLLPDLFALESSRYRRLG